MAYPASPNPYGWFGKVVTGLSQLCTRLMLAVEDWREHFALDSELAELVADGALDCALADGNSKSLVGRTARGSIFGIASMFKDELD